MPVELIAHEIVATDYVIEPCGPRREWMDKSYHKAAYRCLPLTMANQVGWVIRCPTRFKATYNTNSPSPKGLTLSFTEHPDVYSQLIKSQFGTGIVTFIIPWLFRTSEGYGLMVRGPTNFAKEDAAPLDGLVETDWAPYTFTMNWRIMGHLKPVWFNKGDPICMIFPYPLDLAEQVEPRMVKIESNPKLKAEFEMFAQHRRETWKEQKEAEKEGEAIGFRLDYLKGMRPEGEKVHEHRTGFNLKPFADERK